MNNFEIHASLYINTNINILTSVQYPLQSNDNLLTLAIKLRYWGYCTYIGNNVLYFNF